MKKRKTDPDNPPISDETIARMRPAREVLPEVVAAAKKRKNDKATKFDAATYLQSNNDIAAYLSEALRSADARLFSVALRNVIRAKGLPPMTRHSPDSDGRTDMATIFKIMNALGMRLIALPKERTD